MCHRTRRPEIKCTVRSREDGIDSRANSEGEQGVDQSPGMLFLSHLESVPNPSSVLVLPYTDTYSQHARDQVET